MCSVMVEVFGDWYLRLPTANDIARLLHIGKQRGFPEMLGSLDCSLVNMVSEPPLVLMWNRTLSLAELPRAERQNGLHVREGIGMKNHPTSDGS
ncbi:hypothetical protein ACS0TY_025122 [Phlomoides rotata]